MKETKKHIDFRAMSREEIETYAVSMTDKVEQLSMQLSWYEEQLRLSRKKRFGASSEKTDAAQINMFNEAESEAQEDRKEPSMGEVKPPASRKKKGHKDQLLKPLPKEAISYTLSEEEALCPVCGERLHEMKKEVRKELVVIPAKYIVREHVTYSYACRNCEKHGIEAPVVKAGAKEGLFRNSIASASLVSDIIIKKYQQAQPLYRQEQALRLQGLRLSRQSMANWIVQAANQYLKPLYELLHEELLQRAVIHADETTLEVLKEPGRDASTESYMWLYRSGGCDAKQLDYEARRAYRMEHAKPVWEAFLTWAKDTLPQALPKSKLHEALQYVSKQAIPLGNYLLDGRLELSNNRAERSIKPFVIGRKNWLFSNTPKGADASAIIYSIMETAKESGLKPFEYFQHLLEELPQIDRTDKEKLKRYLPYSDALPAYCKAPDQETNN